MDTITIVTSGATLHRVPCFAMFDALIGDESHTLAITQELDGARQFLTHVATGCKFCELPPGCGDLVERAKVCVDIIVAKFGAARVLAGIRRAPLITGEDAP